MTLELAEHSALRDSVLQVFVMPVSSWFQEKFAIPRLLSPSSINRVTTIPMPVSQTPDLKMLSIRRRLSPCFKHSSKRLNNKSTKRKSRSMPETQHSVNEGRGAKGTSSVKCTEINLPYLKRRLMISEVRFQRVRKPVVAARPFARCPGDLSFSGFVRSSFDRLG